VPIACNPQKTGNRAFDTDSHVTTSTPVLTGGALWMLLHVV
jgi:hypothetical protein